MNDPETTLPSEVRDALAEAGNLGAQGRLLEAERIYRSLAVPGEQRGVALEALARLFLQQQRLDEAHSALRELTADDPDSLRYCGMLAGFLDSAGQTQAAVDEYQRFIDRQPDNAIARFNMALLQKKLQRLSDALASYREAIRLGIDRSEEVYSNMGVLYSEMQDAENARAMFEKALAIAPTYVPALFNLAGHYEELGEKDLALDFYERILVIEPGHWESLARMAYPQKITPANRMLVDRIAARIDELPENGPAQEGLYFALGKAYDDLEEYDRAAEAYVAANELGKQRVPAYVPVATEEAFDRLIDGFDADWVDAVQTDCDDRPIFICGMYRSGSTLLERMLGSHPQIAPGGELDFLPWSINRHLGPFPQTALDATTSQLQDVAREYEAQVREFVADAGLVTDKRPDNFLRVGLIRAIFPKAKIIRTRRDLRDNSLSLYFQQFDRAATYANDLGHIAHYYRQQERLFDHWQHVIGADGICTVDYEALIDSPEETLRRVLDFLGLEWDAGVLDFHESGGMVKTASIWQVREGLHSGSRERWRNYEMLLNSLENVL